MGGWVFAGDGLRSLDIDPVALSLEGIGGEGDALAGTGQIHGIPVDRCTCDV